MAGYDNLMSSCNEVFILTTSSTNRSAHLHFYHPITFNLQWISSSLSLSLSLVSPLSLSLSLFLC